MKITTRDFIPSLSPSIIKKSTIQKVQLDVKPGLVLIRDAKTSEYRGMLKYGSDVAKAMEGIGSIPDVTLNGLLNQHRGHMEIQVYGLSTQGEDVGNILSADNVFLQVPDKSSAPYFNPQSLNHFQGTLTELPGNESNGGPVSEILNQAMAAKLYDTFGSTDVPMHFHKLAVNDKLQTRLKRHQEAAVAMMAERESGNLLTPQFPSLWTQDSLINGDKIFKNMVSKNTQMHFPQLCLGGLFADEMGLGKTLSTLALIVGTTADEFSPSPSTPTPASRQTLIVAPLTALGSWEKEIKCHVKPGLISYTIYRGKKRHEVPISSFALILTNYETLEADARHGKSGSCLDILWHRVVLDEAHIIRNRRSRIFQVVCSLKARHRWCLTGTPIQNRLEDFGALLQFLGVYPYDTPHGFSRVLPANGRASDATGWHLVTALFRAVALRRTKMSIGSELDLPKRTVVRCPVELNEDESRVYDKLIQAYGLGSGVDGNAMTTLQVILCLRQVCDHGLELLPPTIRQWLASGNSFNPPPMTQVCELHETTIETEDPGIARKESSSPCPHLVCTSRGATLDNGRKSSDETGDLSCPLCSGSATTVDKSGFTRLSDGSDYVPSSKVQALLNNLKETIQCGWGLQSKSVVFSCWTRMLDLIGLGLEREGIAYQRIDGSKTFQQRCKAIADFRDGSSYPVMLASLGSAALGLNLTAANEVHLMEPGWNPMLERQALDRVYRLGQTRPVRALFYVVQRHDSIEEFVLSKQQHKIQVSSISVGDTDNDGYSEGGLDPSQIMDDCLPNLSINREGSSREDPIIID